MQTDLLEHALCGIGPESTALLWQESAFGNAAGASNKAVIFGSGYLGQVALSGALRAGVTVLAFADNNRALWGHTVNGIPVVSPECAVAQHNKEAFFVTAIYNATAPREQLSALGCERIICYPLFFWQFSKFMPEEDRLELPHRIVRKVHAIRHGYDVLEDLESRKEFAAQIRWRCSLDHTCLPTPQRAADMYYGPELFRLGRETFVDCGAFDGDSIRQFLDKTGGSFEHIYALEPDPQNLESLRKYVCSLETFQSTRVSVLPFGVSDRNGAVPFSITGTVGSRIVDSSQRQSGPQQALVERRIECRRLDDLLDGEHPTLIKMDIEGAEPQAIQGAARIMAECRPILAVCAYHKCEHLWTLPVLMKSILPEYRIFLRRYAEDCWETVYYAIPPERARI
jgi:FkbM family methyltransferase